MAEPNANSTNASAPLRGEVVPPARSSSVGNLVSLVGLVLAGLYLANPGAAIIEFIPDILPGVGNIDEAVATTIFLACLSRLGINILPQRSSRSDRKE